MKNLRNKNAPPNTDVVQVYLESSWDIVTQVYAHLAEIETLSDLIEAGDLDNVITAEDLDSLAKLNALVLDATLGDSTDFATAAQGALADSAIQGPFANQAEAEAGTDNTKAMTPLRVAQAIAVLAAGIQNNFDAAVDPAPTDDTSEGYSAGSVWINTTASPNESWRCSDATVNNAVWVHTTLTADEISTVGLSGDSDDLIEGATQLLLTVAERAKLVTLSGTNTGDESAASVSTPGIVELATIAETDTGTDATRALTPAGLKGSALQSKVDLIEPSATADQSNAEIKSAFITEVPLISQGDAEAGVAAIIESWSAERVAQAIAALAPASGAVATDIIWDAAGDLAVGTGADTATKLTMGTALQQLRVNAGATALEYFTDAGGGGGLTVEHKTASFTAEAGKKYKVTSVSGAVVVTLPAGNDLDNIVIQDVGGYAATNNITVNPNGAETIDGSASFVIDQNYGDIDIGYKNSATDWAVSADGVTEFPSDSGYIGQNLQTGTAYELVLSDAGKMIEMNNASANVLTIPANTAVAFPVDTRIDITQGGAGLTSVTITTDTLNGELVSRGQWKGLSLWKKSATVWVIYGGTT